MSTDPHGQPLNIRFNRARRAERDLCEMLGMVKGVLADGVVNPAEAAALKDWAMRHPDATEQWPVNILKERLDAIFADGKVSKEEQRDLAELLEAVVGGKAGIIAGKDAATDLPVDRPPPKFVWTDSVFVFTGKFAFGPRIACERAVVKLKGACERSVTKETDYLIIGTFGSRDWVHTSFGRKIQKAVEYREAGTPLAIAAEDHWVSALPER
jgi:NAD-dependent DNA ligase